MSISNAKEMEKQLLTMYSLGAINSIVPFLASGRRAGSPYDFVTGSYWNSSGTVTIISIYIRIVPCKEILSDNYKEI